MEIGKDNINLSRMVSVGRPIGNSKVSNDNLSKVRLQKDQIHSGESFKDVLKATTNNVGEIKFSKHAVQRMQDRKINLSHIQLQNMKGALEKARGKGVKDSLILMENTAFIVNIPTGTVITAVDNDHIRENVFTNIDGAIII